MTGISARPGASELGGRFKVAEGGSGICHRCWPEGTCRPGLAIHSGPSAGGSPGAVLCQCRQDPEKGQAVASGSMSDSSWSIRPATAEDGEFLADVLVEAVNWSPEWKPKSRRRVLSDPRTAHYIAGWPRETDLGVIAEAGAEPVGAAWVRFFPADDPAYGFVGPDVPNWGSASPPPGAAGAWAGTCCGPSPRWLRRRASGGSVSAWSGRTSPAACTCLRASRWSTPATRSPTPWLRASRVAIRRATVRGWPFDADPGEHEFSELEVNVNISCSRMIFRTLGEWL